ncbi:MAG: MarR family transcriptional regulator [Tistlia sp.]|uniref:MarR family winged helix-turn-helix transcriptional regulator n=1 Tax=Tistlia sp. TaxID=3057121 RepID=UPI0034A490F4
MARQTTASKEPCEQGDRLILVKGGGRPEDVAARVRDLHRQFGRVLQQRISELGLTLGTWYFLRALWEEDGLSQRELSQRIGTMEPTTVSALNAMERLDLVRRERDPHDKRRRRVFLTEHGRSLKQQALGLLGELDRQALGGLSPSEIGQLHLLLDGVLENLRVQRSH